MGFFQTFNKKGDVKKEISSSNLDDMPPPPQPDKSDVEIKEAVKERQEEKSPIPPPPQFKEPKPGKKLPEAPKPEQTKIEEPKAEDFSLIDIDNDNMKPMDIPEPQKPQTTLKSGMQGPGLHPLDQMSLPFGDMTELEPKKKVTIKMTVPDTLPEMPLFDSTAEEDESSYTFTQESPIAEDIPYFTNVNVEPQKDEFEELFNLPVIDMEEDTESYGRFKYRELKKPLFIRTDNYSQILTNIDTMKTYVEESSDKISMLNNLKRNADIEHKKYKQVLEDIQRKLIYIDRVLFD